MTEPPFRLRNSAGLQQNVHVESGWAYGVIGADLHVFRDQGPVYLLTEHQPHASAHIAERLPEQPSLLLDARRRLVAFTGRDQEQRELADWRDANDPGLAVKWLHGPGGQGKTRLADRFAERSAAAGWKVVNALRGPGAIHPKGGSQDLRLRYARGVLVVVDYADRWPLSYLTWFFSNALLHQDVPARVLLVARTARPWAATRAALESSEIRAHTSDLLLRPLAGGGDLGERERMFVVARDRFAACYGIGVAEASGIAPPASLEHPDFGLTLALHMAALVAVDAHQQDITAPEDLANLSAYLLGRERVHWQNLHESQGEGLDFRTPPSDMARAVFGAALTGAVSHSDGKSILRGLDLEGHPERILTDQAVCYPPTDQSTVLEPLYPDRLSEDFLALMLPGHCVSWHPPDTWAGDAALHLVVRSADGSTPAYLSRALTFLAAAAGPGRWPHVARYLTDILRPDPGLAVSAGSAAMVTLADACDAAVLEAIAAELPDGPHVDLDIGSAAIVQRLVDQRLAERPDPATEAHLHAMRGYRLINAGENETAVAAYTECVRIRRQLVESGLGFQAELARALNNLGNGLSELGRTEEALRCLTEAVDIRRPLLDENPGENFLLLASELMNLGGVQLSLGQHHEAQETMTEAVEIRRHLADFDPELFGADLADPLAALGVGLSESGRTEEGLRFLVEAVAIHRRLAEANPAEAEPHFAQTLTNLGGVQSESGQHHEAHRTMTEAVEIFRRMSGINATAFEPGLAGALSNLRLALLGLNREREAQAAVAEAVHIYRGLVQSLPTVYEPLLARSLVNLGFHLHQAGKHQEALQADDEAVAIYRRTSQEGRGPHGSEYAAALVSRGAQLSPMGNHEEATRSTDEAVRIYRRIIRERPGSHEADLAHALNNRACFLSRMKRQDESLRAYEESVGIYLRITRDDPEADRAGLAQALRNYGLQLVIQGLNREAYAATDDAISAYRRLEETSPGAHTGNLAMALRQLSGLLLWPEPNERTSVPIKGRARRKRGLRASAEAVEVRRRQDTADPGRYTSDLAAELMAFARVRIVNKTEIPQAMRAAEEAVAIHRRLAHTDPATHQGDLAESLTAFESWRSEFG